MSAAAKAAGQGLRASEPEAKRISAERIALLEGMPEIRRALISPHSGNGLRSVSVFAMFDGAAGLFGSMGSLPLFLLFIVAMYFLLFAPQQKKQKQWQATLSALKVGDKVTTSGGMRGSVVMMKDDAVIVKIQPDNLKVEIVKSAIAAVDPAETPKA